MRNRMLLKLLVLGGISVLLLIALASIGGITRERKQRLREVEQIKEMRSQSRPGISSITIELLDSEAAEIAKSQLALAEARQWLARVEGEPAARGIECGVGAAPVTAARVVRADGRRVPRAVRAGGPRPRGAASHHARRARHGAGAELRGVRARARQSPRRAGPCPRRTDRPALPTACGRRSSGWTFSTIRRRAPLIICSSTPCSARFLRQTGKLTPRPCCDGCDPEACF